LGFTDKYILQIAAETERIAPVMLYKIVYDKFRPHHNQSDQKTSIIAAAVTNKILCNKPSNEVGVTFLRDNLSEVCDKASSLSSDRKLCGILSGAAYNIAYGRFLRSGGKRGLLMNPFLGFVRALSQSYSATGPQAMDAYSTWRQYQDALQGQRDSVEPLVNLHGLELFIPLEHNPNERAYYEAVAHCLQQLQTEQPVA
jgi:hypothetical protein